MAGLRILVLERAKFPREKVCGDCLNPSCWPVLERLGVADEVRAAPHGILSSVEFVGVDGQSVSAPLPAGSNAEIAIKRSLLDEILLRRARSLGAEIREGETLLSLSREGHWKLTTDHFDEAASILVAADGRNSSVARLCGLMRRNGRDRVALQSHVPLPENFGDRVVLQLLREGYSGQAPVGDGLLDLCLVSRPNDLPALKSWAQRQFAVPLDHPWRTIAPRFPQAGPDCSWSVMQLASSSRSPAKESTMPFDPVRLRRTLFAPEIFASMAPRIGDFTPAGFGSTPSRARPWSIRASPPACSVLCLTKSGFSAC
jgi:menaquinone-9 beta-reductase